MGKVVGPVKLLTVLTWFESNLGLFFRFIYLVPFFFIFRVVFFVCSVDVQNDIKYIRTILLYFNIKKNNNNKKKKKKKKTIKLVYGKLNKGARAH